MDINKIKKDNDKKYSGGTSPVYFTPSTFGGYTFAMIMSGVLIGNTGTTLTFSGNLTFAVLSLAAFIWGVNFYKGAGN